MCVRLSLFVYWLKCFISATFQVLGCHMWLVVTILDRVVNLDSLKKNFFFKVIRAHVEIFSVQKVKNEK